MAKASGIGWTTLSVDDSAGTLTDVKNDVTNLQFSTPRGVQDVTGVDKSAMERLLLLADMSLTLNGVFNATGSHLIFRTVPSTSVAREFNLTVNAVILGVTGTPTLLFTDYSLTRAQDGSLTWTAPGVLANGVVPTWST
jgi:hypothetical protein